MQRTPLLYFAAILLAQPTAAQPTAAQYTPGSLTLLGSGFTPSLTVQVDNQTITPVTVTGSTKATLPLPVLAGGVHQVTVILPGQLSYLLPVAFTTP
jgi:hypothetical protein